MTMISRATITSDLLDAVRAAYGISWDGEPRDCGGVNLNVHLPSADGGYVVRVYAPWTSRQRLAAIQTVRTALVEAGLPFVLPLNALSGEGFITFDGRVVEVEPFRPGENMTIEQLPAGAAMLARVHDALRTIDAGPRAREAAHPNHVEADLALAWTVQGADAIRHERISDDELRTADAAEELAHALRPLELGPSGGLVRQLVHGDFWDNNVLHRGDEIAVLLDLDFMGDRPRVDDLALTLYYANSTLAMDGRGDERLAISSAIVRAYAGATQHPLTGAEWEALPLALARTVLCFVGMVPMIENDASRRRHVRLSGPDIAWSLGIVQDLDRWQRAFSAPR
jgi:Ser/Thr protein kinase RdoA (MazF antagonist)